MHITGEDLLGEPWCDNWNEIVIDPTVLPINKSFKYIKGGDRKSANGSKYGSTTQS